MAFISNNDDDDETFLSEVRTFCKLLFLFVVIFYSNQDATIPKSFITMHVTDPFATAMEATTREEYPNAKRNLLDEINDAAHQQTMLPPPPPQKENLAIFLRYLRIVKQLYLMALSSLPDSFFF